LSKALAAPLHQRPDRLARFAPGGDYHPNLDFPTGPAYYLMGFDIPMFTPIFVMSRITGWTAHIIEQIESNSQIRPLSAYSGADQRAVPAPASCLAG